MNKCNCEAKKLQWHKTIREQGHNRYVVYIAEGADTNYLIEPIDIDVKKRTYVLKIYDEYLKYILYSNNTPFFTGSVNHLKKTAQNHFDIVFDMMKPLLTSFA